jgi:hypothetical protein
MAASLAACSSEWDAPGRRRFHDESGIAFDVPATWTVHDAYVSFTGGSVIAIMGTLPVDVRCGSEHVDINCYYEQQLSPGTISLVLGIGSFGGGTLFDERPPDPLEIGRSRTEIGGLPAIVHRYGPGGYYEQDEGMGWEIAFPRSVLNAYGIQARLRGPGLPAMQAQLDRLIASIAFDDLGPVVGDRPEDAEPAVAAALRELDRRTRRGHVARPEHVTWYSCFPSTAGATARRIVSFGPEGPLAELRALACRWRAAPESRRLWRVTLELDGGRYSETLWLTADGMIAGQRRGGTPP